MSKTKDKLGILICDKENEKKCYRNLIKISDFIQTHNELIKSETKRQDSICGALWALSQRLAVLRRGAPLSDVYPSDIKYRIECEILYDFQNLYSDLTDSVDKIHLSFCDLQNQFKDFITEVKNVDSELLNYLLQGSTKFKPIQFYLELIASIIEHFQEFLVSIKNLLILMKPDNDNTIENYREYVKVDRRNFDEYLKSSLSYLTRICKVNT